MVTGVGRTAGIASQLAASGWNVAFAYRHAYDERITWGPESGATAAITQCLERHGAASAAIKANLVVVAELARIFDVAQRALGNVTALVMCHCESAGSRLLDTPVENRQRHRTWPGGYRQDAGHGPGRVHRADPTRPARHTPGRRASRGLPLLAASRLDQRPVSLQQRRFRLRQPRWPEYCTQP
jgi:hypothetical protein